MARRPNRVVKRPRDKGPPVKPLMGAVRAGPINGTARRMKNGGRVKGNC